MQKLFLCCLLLLSVRAADTTPKQVHIALAGQDKQGWANTVNIAWFTQDLTLGSHVMFGTDPSSLIFSAMSKAPATQYLVSHGYHHSVELPALKAGVRYYYKVGDPSNTWSGVFNFMSPDPTKKSFAVSIFGDMGYLGSKERLMKITKHGLEKNWSAVPTRNRLEILKNAGKFDMMWVVGDISYADDAFAHAPVKFGYEDTLNSYMDWMQNITAYMPFMVSAGNHESECHSPACVVNPAYGQGLRNFSAFNHRFHMPSKISGGVENMWYSYNYGPVHFVNMNSETDWVGAGEENKGDSGIYPAGHFAADGEYLKWLEADLKEASLWRKVRPWIIAGSHRPFPSIDTVNTNLTALFKKYGVDMYFAGHAHSYTRSVPSIGGVVDRQSMRSNHHFHNAQAPTYIVVGGAGCDEMDYVVDPETLEVRAVQRIKRKDNMVPEGSELKDVHTSQYATGVLTVHNGTSLLWELIDSTTGEILDHIALTKEAVQ